jgi:enhancer of polycomb-like protein
VNSRQPFDSFSQTPDARLRAIDALAHSFTYLMDERDKEWLDKNNEEARGEGTSAQGAVPTSGTTTSTSQRSAK